MTFSKINCMRGLSDCQRALWNLPKGKDEFVGYNRIVSKINNLRDEYIQNLPMLSLSEAETKSFNDVFQMIKSAEKKHPEYLASSYIQAVEFYSNQIKTLLLNPNESALKEIGDILNKTEDVKNVLSKRTLSPNEKTLLKEHLDAIAELKIQYTQKHSFANYYTQLDGFRRECETLKKSKAPAGTIIKELTDVIFRFENLKNEVKGLPLSPEQAVQFKGLCENLSRDVELVKQKHGLHELGIQKVIRYKEYLSQELNQLEEIQRKLVGFTSKYHHPNEYSAIQSEIKDCMERIKLVETGVRGLAFPVNDPYAKHFDDTFAKVRNLEKEMNKKLEFQPRFYEAIKPKIAYLVTDVFQKVMNWTLPSHYYREANS